jgi:hyperosmotically inducible protein
MTFRIAFAVIAASFLLSSASQLSAAEGVQGRSDTQITEDVVRSVNTYTRFTVFDDIQVQVVNGVVTLTGRVTMPFKKDEIGKRAAALDGVKQVRNDIGVLPPSQFDDDLRHRIARAIYGNAAFWQYAAMPNPPIHIVVEGGRVTLTGVVHSDVDRMLARSLACGNGEISLTSALRTDAEAR